MPQGLQVWDAAGNLIVDTSVSVLRDLVATVVENTTTSVQTIAVAPPSEATVLSTALIVTGTDTDLPPETNYNSGTGNLEYKWGVGGGGKFAQVKTLLY